MARLKARRRFAVLPAFLAAALLPGVAAAQGAVVEERHEVETTRQVVQPTASPAPGRTTVESHEKRTTVETAPAQGTVKEKSTVETYESE